MIILMRMDFVTHGCTFHSHVDIRLPHLATAIIFLAPISAFDQVRHLFVRTDGAPKIPY